MTFDNQLSSGVQSGNEIDVYTHLPNMSGDTHPECLHLQLQL